MTYLEAMLLAVIQGLTEFLPISSSAHLILFSEFMSSNQNLFYDVSLHLGTLIAVCLYFRSDLMEIFSSVIQNKSLSNSLLLKQLFISCIPTLLLGFILSSMFEDDVRRTLLLSMGEWSYLSDRPVTIVLLMICLLIWSTPLWYRTKH